MHFFYDFDLPRTLTSDDPPEIEARMRRVIAEDHPVHHRVVSADEARELFSDQPYKIELIEGLMQRQQEAVDGDYQDIVLSTFRQDGFEDLCRGPHVQHTGEIPTDALKLLTVSGAYWLGDEHRPMLQRIYGTAWHSREDLDTYLWQVEEAKKRQR